MCVTHETMINVAVSLFARNVAVMSFINPAKSLGWFIWTFDTPFTNYTVYHSISSAEWLIDMCKCEVKQV